MSRLQQLPPDEWDEDLKTALKPDVATPLEQGLMRFFAHRPELVKGLLPFAGALKTERTLPDRLIELVRLRVAYFNQCRSCMAIRYTDAIDDGLDEDVVCSLEHPVDADNLTPAEKSAIKYGELLATDHLRIDEDVYAELRQHFTEPQIVELGMQAAFFVGFGRLAATYHMVEELPQAFQGEGDRPTPWNQESIQVR